jgi:hypothetical protein
MAGNLFIQAIQLLGPYLAVNKFVSCSGDYDEEN